MTDQRISELGAATLPLAGTEQVPIVQGGETKRVSAADLSSPLAGYASGTYLVNIPNGNVTRTVTNNLLLFTPIILRAPMTLSEFSVRSANAPGSGESWAIALYETMTSNLPVGAPIYAGAAVTPGYNFNQVGYSGISLVLRPGLYWFAFVGVGGGSYQNVNTADAARFIRTFVGLDTFDAIGSTLNNLTPAISSVTPGVWPTLSGTYSDFTSIERDFMAPFITVRQA